MMIDARYLQAQLRLPYHADLWRTLFPTLLPGVELFAVPVERPLDSAAERELATAFRQVGRAALADGKVVALCEVATTPGVDLLRNRVGLRTLVARAIDEVSAHAVLAFFLPPAGGDPAAPGPYRLTYAARETRLGPDPDTGVLTEFTRETAPRRYTFVLGPGEAARTAADRLARLAADTARRGPALPLDAVTDAFSVERLNKEFFTAYKDHYRRFCDHLTAAPPAVFGLDPTLLVPGADRKTRDRALKPVRDFVKRLLGRLVFLHFLQRKGWLGCDPARTDWTDGDHDFLRCLFDTAPAAERDRFHSTRLVPLFFETLNRADRPGDVFAVTGKRVPYLNGGLFERDFPGVETLDFPAALFDELLVFFGQYHFTIDENDPEEREVGIDPEMLGHIFENLLEDNKDKGAYYTPKPVVQYMCQQSLGHYLKGKFPADDPAALDEIDRFLREKSPVDVVHEPDAG